MGRSHPADPSMSGLNFRLRKQIVIQFRVHHCLLNDHLVSFVVSVDGGLQEKRNHHALHGPELTLVDPHCPHLAIHAARRSLDFHVQKTLFIDPDVLHGAAFGGELQFIGVVTFHRLYPLNLDRRSLCRVVD